jgi:formylglycine-generating enzyme
MMEFDTRSASMKSILPLIILLVSPICANAVMVDTVLIGNPNNFPDLQPQGLFGAVSTSYQMGVTEVTNTQYVEFLNAVAASDPYELYHANMSFSSKGGITRDGSPGSYSYSVKPDTEVDDDDDEVDEIFTYTYADKPVVFVSWYDAIRFTNWLHNGQGSGSTETGAYTLLGGMPTPSNGDSITRNSGATWFLPTESEWYKAAYYDGAAGVYYDYPTGTNSVPDNNLPAEDTGNSANFLQDDPLTQLDNTTGSASYPHTDVGAYTLSESPYGTFDQAGNVWEWNQTLIAPGLRGRRGGAWSFDSSTLHAANQGSFNATFQADSVGFRVAAIAIPEELAGDFNEDGNVDAADYVIWRKNDGSQAEYDEWRSNFGMTSPGGGSLAHAVVPEPLSLLLLLTGSMLHYGRRCRTTRSPHAR